jgi:hypothetical protein
MLILPPGWEAANAPVANALAMFPPLVWWAVAVALLAAGFVLAARAPRWAVLLAAGAALALGVASDGLVDDAYIQFRYAQNLAAGHGMVFNPGERIEGASGGVWIGALAIGPLIGVDAGVWGRLLSLSLTVLATLAAGAAGARIGGARAGAHAALVWASLPTNAMYAATGLETAAYGLVLWLAALAAFAWRARAGWAAGAAISALRPEGLVLGIAASPWIRKVGRRPRAVLLGVLGGAAAMVAARLGYFGAPLPHSATVKGFTAAAGVVDGLGYLARGALEWWPLLVAVPVLWGTRRALLPGIAPVAVWTALVVARGGDWMPGSRYLLPLLVILVAAAASPSLSRWTRLAAPLLTVWACVLLLPLPDPSVRFAGSAWRAMAEHRVQSRWWEALGTLLRRTVPEGTTLASGPSGALPYASGMRTFDMFGLCSVVTARRAGGTGHRLWGIQQAVGQRDIIYIGSVLPQVLDPRAVAAAAEEQVANVAGIRPAYQPVLVMHSPEAHLDVVADVLWVRPSLAPRLADLAGAATSTHRP